MHEVVTPAKRIRGTVTVPGDKSISHRALMLGAIAEGTTSIEGLSKGEDARSTIRCLRQLGIKVTLKKHQTLVHGRGLEGLREASAALDVGNSGTTIRLLSGLLVGHNFASTVTGDDSIRKRPMNRIIEPLRQMGARIEASEGGRAPLTLKGGPLSAIHYHPPVASAQVKSCVLFAGLYADGKTSVDEVQRTRDHTERMLQTFGAEVEQDGGLVSVMGRPTLRGQEFFMPGDLSAAAFFVAAAILLPGSEVKLENVGINPTRHAFISVLTELGANIDILNVTSVHNELVADLFVTHSGLSALSLNGASVPQLIDEIPILAVLATQAEGVTEIKGAQELRLKESDRLNSITVNLTRMGAKIEETEDGLVIEGPVKLHQAELDSFGDHRIAMACAVASLMADQPCTIQNAACADISFPGFFSKMKELAVA